MGSSSFKYKCPACFHEHPVFKNKCPETGRDIHVIYRQNGRILNEKYQITEKVGEGGMGVVYRGIHKVIGRKIAVKFLFPDVKMDGEAVSRFRKEARIAASIVHKNVVDILDMDSTPEGIPYIVMEYLDGNDLHDIMKAAGRLSEEVAAGLCSQVLSALNAIHSKGIVHRDLKPENVFVMKQAGGEQIVKIVDFGISHLTRPLEIGTSGSMGKTQEGAIVGTPKYMSPEQAGSETVDRRSDLYSVGVILYEMVTGRLPYEAANYNKLIVAILTAEPTKPSVYNPEISPPFERIIMKAIEKDPDERFSNALEFSRALDLFRLRRAHASRGALAEPSEEGAIVGDKTVIGYAVPSVPGVSEAPPVRIMDADGTAVGIGQAVSRTAPEHILSTSASTSLSDTPRGRRRARRRRTAILATTLAVAAALGAFFIYRAYSGTEGRGKTFLMLNNLPARKAAKCGPAAVKRWSLSIDGAPEKASVFVDDVLCTALPVVVEERDAERKIRIEAPGYQPWLRSVAVRADTILSVQMVPEKEKIGGSPKTAKPPGEGKKKKTDAMAEDVKTKKEEETTGQKEKKKIDITYPGLKKQD